MDGYFGERGLPSVIEGVTAGEPPKAPEVPKEPLPLLSHDLFFSRNRIRVERVDVPELEGSVLVKEMTANERDSFEAGLVVRSADGKNQQVSTQEIRAKLAQKTVVNEKHEPMFTEAEIYKLGQMSASAMDCIYKRSSQLSGITDEDVDEIAKNSASGPPAEH